MIPLPFSANRSAIVSPIAATIASVAQPAEKHFRRMPPSSPSVMLNEGRLSTCAGHFALQPAPHFRALSVAASSLAVTCSPQPAWHIPQALDRSKTPVSEYACGQRLRGHAGGAPRESAGAALPRYRRHEPLPHEA